MSEDKIQEYTGSQFNWSFTPTISTDWSFTSTETETEKRKKQKRNKEEREHAHHYTG